MQLPIKAHYATVAMLALASRYATDELLTARTIAAEQQIPSQFLGQILQQLRAAGLITSTRGSSGGFRLSRAPEDISIAEIVDAVCPIATTGVPSAELKSASAASQVMQGVWDELAKQQRLILEELSLGQLADQMQPATSVMFYI